MERQITVDYRPLGLSPAMVGNLLILGVLVYMAWLEGSDPDHYRMSLQEDEYLEWATFWAFIGAAALAVRSAWQSHKASEQWWFQAGFALFCFVVAMEEISWAQRLIDYRPPTYFLEHNFQQEPNLHNVMSTDFRKLALKAVIIGYGIALPIAALFSPIATRFRRHGIRTSPIALIPGFAAAYWLYESYPWDYSGEIVELMLGLGFLFAGLAIRAREQDSGAAAVAPRRLSVAFVGGWAIVMLLGLATAAAARFQTSARLENVDAAKVELEALKNDFLRMSNPERNAFVTRCGIHKRVYSYVEKYDRDYLYRGSYADLQRQGLSEERAKFFIDPWNAPYWIRDRCSDGQSRRVIFVYSFGPNRRRDSSTWEVLGDDVGAYIHVSGSVADDADGE